MCAHGAATIGPAIFPKLLRGLGMDPTKATIKAMWEELDTDKNGEVDFEEFCAFMKDRHRVKSRSEAEKELREAFKELQKAKRAIAGLWDSDVRSLWSEAVGANAWAVDASVAAFCGAAAVIYHGIVGDVFGPLVEKYLDIPPSITVYAVALLALFPLCQLDLATLAKFSLMGCASVFLTAFAILYRAVDGTYAPDGIHRESAVASAATGGCCGVSAKALVLSANLGLAYVAHYNAPPLAESLARGDGGARRRFRQVTFLSFTVLVALYAGVMAAGKATFGDAARAFFCVLLFFVPSLCRATSSSDGVQPEAPPRRQRRDTPRDAIDATPLDAVDAAPHAQARTCCSTTARPTRSPASRASRRARRSCSAFRSCFPAFTIPRRDCYRRRGRRRSRSGGARGARSGRCASCS